MDDQEQKQESISKDNSELESLTEISEDELQEIAKDLDVHPEDEQELLQKIAKREANYRQKIDEVSKKLNKSIQQKIKQRERADQSQSDKQSDQPTPGDTQGKTLTEADINKLLDEREAKRDLQSLNLPDEIESEVRDLAKVKNITIREAAKLPYIESRLKEVEDAKRIASATPKRTSRGNYTQKTVDPAKPLDPSDFALDTEEGQKAWAEAKAARRRFESQS